MGLWSQTIGGNDLYLDIEARAVETCGIDLDRYLADSSLLTPELLDANISEIVDHALNREYHEGTLALGVLIMTHGGYFPGEGKDAVLEEVQHELDNYTYDSERQKQMRQYYLKEFKSQLENYVEGIRQEVREESLFGLTFIQEFLNPTLKELKLLVSPLRFQKLLRLMMKNLSAPFNEIFRELGCSTPTKIHQFMADLVKYENLIECGILGREESLISMFTRALKDHYNGRRTMKNFWLDTLNIESKTDQLDLQESDDSDAPYRVYGMSFFGKKYVGSCEGPIHRRLEQHISKFKVLPMNGEI